MRMTKRRERWLLWLAGIVVCLMLSVGAAVSAQAAGRQVYDDAGLFSDSEISELTAAVNVAEEETGEMDMTRFTPHTPSTLQMTVMMAVATMMPTMACTTAVVVASPTAWALRPQWMP